MLWLHSRTSITDFRFRTPLPNSRPASRDAAASRGSLLANSINFDPLTLGVVALTAAVAAVSRRLPEAAALGSALLYVAYTISVGGDFMSGRFFAMPLLVAALVLTPMIQRRETALAAGVGLLVYNVSARAAPSRPAQTIPTARGRGGCKMALRRAWSLPLLRTCCSTRLEPSRPRLVPEGISFRNSTEKVSVQGSIGFFGFSAGPTKYVIDRNALSDPLLARLPVSESLYFEFYAGHFFRDLPGGYIESRRERRNLIADPMLHDYYDKLVNVTSGPLLSADRFRDIWDLNVGRYRRFTSSSRNGDASPLSVAATTSGS